MIFVKINAILFFLLLYFCSLNLYAEDSSFEKELIEKNKEISKEIDDIATSIDEFLSSRREVKRNRSSVNLMGFSEFREGGYFKQTGHVNLALKLPNTEKDWMIKLSSYDEEDEFEGLQRNREGARPQSEKYGTSVGFARSLKGINATVRPRIEFKDPLVSSFLFKLEQTMKFSGFNLRWQSKFFAHSVDGTGEAFALDFDKKLSKKILLRLFNEEQYLDKYHQFTVSQGPSILYTWSDRMAISKTISFNSANRNFRPPDDPYGAGSYHLSSYNFIVSFNHKLYKNIFHYRVTPSLNFEKFNNFKGKAAMIFTTEIIF